MEFYKVIPVNAEITAIKSQTGEIMYLIEGEDHAVLVDTCIGVEGLKELVQKITAKPLTVLLTHGHVDHALGAAAFSDVYMSPLDQQVFKKHASETVRSGYLEMNMGEQFSQLAAEDLLPLLFPDFKPLIDGQTFSLGNLHIDTYALPGHTPGSTIIHVREHGILILGDACNNSTFLFDEDALSVREYRENLYKINKLLGGSFERVFLCHHQMETCPDILENAIEVCDDIINDRADDIPFEFMGNTYYIAKECDSKFKRLDGKEGNLIYDK